MRSLTRSLSLSHIQSWSRLYQSPDVAEVGLGGGGGGRKQRKEGRGWRQSQQQSFKQHTDGFTTHMIKQITHRPSQHSGVKGCSCTVELYRQTCWHLGAWTHTLLNSDFTNLTQSVLTDSIKTESRERDGQSRPLITLAVTSVLHILTSRVGREVCHFLKGIQEGPHCNHCRSERKDKDGDLSLERKKSRLHKCIHTKY